MIKIYGTRKSRAFRCLWALEELNIEYELVPVDWQNGETRKREFLKINPNGHVPVFEHGELRLVESLAINLHISTLANGNVCFSTPLERSKAIEWTIWAMGELEGPHDAANRRDVDVEEELREHSLAVLSQSLSRSTYLVADRFTIADLNVASVLLRPKFAPFVKNYDALQDWFGRCTRRPALAKAAGKTQ